MRWLVRVWHRWQRHAEAVREVDERRAYRATVRSLGRMFGLTDAEARGLLDRELRARNRREAS